MVKAMCIIIEAVFLKIKPSSYLCYQVKLNKEKLHCWLCIAIKPKVSLWKTQCTMAHSFRAPVIHEK